MIRRYADPRYRPDTGTIRSGRCYLCTFVINCNIRGSDTGSADRSSRAAESDGEDVGSGSEIRNNIDRQRGTSIRNTGRIGGKSRLHRMAAR